MKHILFIAAAIAIIAGIAALAAIWVNRDDHE